MSATIIINIGSTMIITENKLLNLPSTAKTSRGIKTKKSMFSLLGLGLITTVVTSFSHAVLLTQGELETGTLSGPYSSIVDTPFGGIGAYGNPDGVEIDTQLSGVPGKFRLDIIGASSNTSAAGISVYLGGSKIGATDFSGTSPTTSSISFTLENTPSNSTLKFVLETDNGSNDTFLDAYELHRTGDIPTPPPAPVLPSQGAYESGVYRNMFAEFGYSEAEVTARLNKVYDQLFHSTDTENKALFIPVGTDMAYIWDVGNNDVRSEGMSYGMMMALQMDRQDDFNKLWKWASTYSLNKTGELKGYFAWKVSTSGQVLDAAPAPDGEEYFATALFFAAHRWGNGSGIYNYEAQANSILKDMFGNGETRYNNNGVLEERSLFNHEEKQIVFSPATPTDRNWTDTSYHLPAFYELWAKWADNNNDFWAEIAVVSRQHFKDAADPATGLTPDYAYFDGTPHGDFQHWKDTFQYDAWRVISNVAMDYAWWKKDEWQVTQVKRLQTFFKGKGINSYSSLYELDGVPYENNTDHSPGLVAMNAVASLASDSTDAWAFVDALWNTGIPEGQYRYYDGSLYMFGMLAMSGNYRIYCPNNECDATTAPLPTNNAPVANADSASTTENLAVTTNVLANDTDADKNVISIASFSQATNGSVSKTGDSLVYTPNANYTGTDSFTYIATDGSENSANATVTVTVTANIVVQPGNNAPVANNDSATTNMDVAVSTDVIANDTDADNNLISIESYTQAANGSVSQSGDSLVYTPNANFTGTDSFTYITTDGSTNSTNATVTVTVVADVIVPVNTAPVANNDLATTNMDVAVSTDVIANDTDADNNVISIASFTQALNGSVSQDGDSLVYTPNAGFIGNDTYTYTATDSKDNSNNGIVTVSVKKVEVDDTTVPVDTVVTIDPVDTVVTIDGDDAVVAIDGIDTVVTIDGVEKVVTIDPVEVEVKGGSSSPIFLLFFGLVWFRKVLSQQTINRK